MKEDGINDALKARQAYLAELKEKAKDKEPKKAAAPAKKAAAATAETTAPVAKTVLAPQAAWPFPTGNKP